jgi:hypothetical protein
VQMPIYSTEYGYKTNPPYSLGASMATAAQYENWAEYLSWRDPRVQTWNQYLLVDPPASASQFATGLEFANGTPKPTLAAWTMPIFLPRTSGSRGTPLEVWGCARRVRDATGAGPQRVAIQFRAASGGQFRTMARAPITHADCYFDRLLTFPSSGTVRLSWSDPGQGTFYSREVAISLS